MDVPDFETDMPPKGNIRKPGPSVARRRRSLGSSCLSSSEHERREQRRDEGIQVMFLSGLVILGQKAKFSGLIS